MANQPGGERSVRDGRTDAGPAGKEADPRLHVEVTLKGVLADRIPGGRAAIELPAGALAEAILTSLDLPVGPCIYAINGAAVKGTAPLHDGDRVVVYPPMAGG